MRRFRAFSPTSSKLFTLASPKTKMAAVTLLSAEGEYSGAQSRIATATVGHGGSSCSPAVLLLEEDEGGSAGGEREDGVELRRAAAAALARPLAVPTRTRLRRPGRRRRRQPMRGLSPSPPRSRPLSLAPLRPPAERAQLGPVLPARSERRRRRPPGRLGCTRPLARGPVLLLARPLPARLFPRRRRLAPRRGGRGRGGAGRRGAEVRGDDGE